MYIDKAIHSIIILIAKDQKQLIGERLNKIWYSPKMEYY